MTINAGIYAVGSKTVVFTVLRGQTTIFTLPLGRPIFSRPNEKEKIVVWPRETSFVSVAWLNHRGA